MPGSSTFDPGRSLGLLRAGLPRGLDAVGRRLAEAAARECPRKSGRLAASLEYAVHADRDEVVAGTNLLYGRFRVLGTRRMAPDDFLTRAALAEADAAARIAQEAMGG
jgi:hypothetical protein